MIIRNDEHKRETSENVFGGSGSVHFKRIIETPEELYGKGRVFSVVTLDPGSELGWHIYIRATANTIACCPVRANTATTAASLPCTRATLPSAPTARVIRW